MNEGLVNAIENELGQRLFIPKYPQVTTSFGAAILAVDSFNYQMVN